MKKDWSIVVKRLKQADKAYYEKNSPLMTDAEYDLLKEKLQKADPKNAYLKAVGSTGRGKKVKLDVTMGSLNKVSPETLSDWLNAVDKDATFIETPKLDGISGELTYVDGVLTQAVTRNDGFTGRVVTKQARHVQGVLERFKQTSLDISGQIVVKGEFIIHNSIFEKEFRGKVRDDGGTPYKVARNFAGGMLNKLDLDKNHIHALNHMTFVTYTICDFVDGVVGHPESKSTEHMWLDKLGFTTVRCPTRYTQGHYNILAGVKSGKYGQTQKDLLPILDWSKALPHMNVEDRKTFTPQFIKAVLKEYREKTDIALDGIVVEVNERAIAKKMGLEANGLNPAYGRAVKLDVSEQETKIGRVDHVEWNISDRGVLKPVIVLKKALNLGGVDVKRMSAYNARTVVEAGIKPGVKVKVIRSGDVIPRLMAVQHNGKWVENKPTESTMNLEKVRNAK